VLAIDAAQRWAQTWRDAWPVRDTEAIVGLYAAKCRHSSAPFREPYEGHRGVRAYFSSAFATETEPATVWFGSPIVTGERAAVEWWARLTEADGPVTLAGCSILTFDDLGLVVDQRDYWHLSRGHVDPVGG
jgi:ketosteroid isomerase-like protein